MGESDLLRRGIRNARWSIGDYLVLPLLWLVTTPYFVLSLGEDAYGIWMFVNALIAFSGVIGLGIAEGTVRLVAALRAKEEIDRIVRLVSSAGILFLVSGLAGGGALFVAAPALVRGFVAVPPDLSGPAVDAIRIGSSLVVLRLLESLATGVMHGFERFDLNAKVRAPFQIVTMVLSLAIVLTGGGIGEILIATAGVAVISVAVRWMIVRASLLPGLTFSLRPDRAILREVLPFSLHSWFQGTGSLLTGQADRLLVASLAGPTALAYYSVCVSLGQQGHALLSHGSAVLLPMSRNSDELADHTVLRDLFYGAMNRVATASLAIGIPLFLLSDPILSFWISPEFAGSAATLLSVLVVAFVFLSTSIVPHYMMNATSLYPLNTKLNLASAGIITLTSVLLIPPFGAIGAAAARFAGIPVSLIGRTAVHRRLLRDRRWYGPLIVFVPFVTVFTVLLIADPLESFAPVSLWPRILVTALVTVVAVSLSAYFLFRFNREEGGTGAREKGAAKETS